jgi:uncharacterized membrane protein (UPF0127 family)
VRQLPILFILLLCAACVSAGPEVELRGETFSVDLATTPKEHALGLMFRDSMAEDHGMLFIFPSATTRNFWMKNTRIPLDIFYFDQDLKLLNVVQHARPCRTSQCPVYSSSGPARYVLELNAGTAAAIGAQPGDTLVLDLD